MYLRVKSLLKMPGGIEKMFISVSKYQGRLFYYQPDVFSIQRCTNMIPRHYSCYAATWNVTYTVVGNFFMKSVNCFSCSSEDTFTCIYLDTIHMYTLSYAASLFSCKELQYVDITYLSVLHYILATFSLSSVYSIYYPSNINCNTSS